MGRRLPFGEGVAFCSQACEDWVSMTSEGAVERAVQCIHKALRFYISLILYSPTHTYSVLFTGFVILSLLL